MQVDVSTAAMAAALRADGIGWGGEGRRLHLPDTAAPGLRADPVGPLWLIVKGKAALRSGIALVAVRMKGARHGTA